MTAATETSRLPYHVGRSAIHHEPDPGVVDRLAAGHPPATRIPLAQELWAAIDRLDGYGYSGSAIARRIGCCERTVTRRRAARAGRVRAA